MTRKGVPNHQYDEVDAVASRCKRCGSTNRTRYFHTQEMELASGKDLLGNPATHVVWRRCKCEDCGQYRSDKTFENRPSILPTHKPPEVDLENNAPSYPPLPVKKPKKVQPQEESMIEEDFLKSGDNNATFDNSLFDQDTIF